MTAKITDHSKTGSRNQCIVTGVPHDQLRDADLCFSIRQDGSAGIRCTNKREWNRFTDLVYAINEAERNQAKSPARTTSRPAGRYLSTLENAELHQLNHGKSWLCTAHAVEANGVDPSFEGEVICYVYPA